MDRSPLREWAKAEPFVPFVVTLGGGLRVRVFKAGMVLFGRRWDVAAWVSGEGCDVVRIMPHDEVESVEAEKL